MAGSSAIADTPSLERAERAAVLEVYAVESALGRARSDAEAWNRRLTHLQVRERALRRDAAIVRRSQAVTQARIASIIRALYENDQPVDPLAIVLGAESLDAALEGVESLSRAASLHQRLVEQARERRVTVRRALLRLVETRSGVEAAAAAADSATRRLEQAGAARRASLDAIRRQRNLSRARVAKLVEEATVAAGASSSAAATSDVTEEAAAAGAAASPEAPVMPPPGETRTMVVDAVAYHLPGRTASGLPVGIGVIAVDPTVIPLGTRVFVPGYGPAVAADTGSAIKGRIIDLWMPTTAQARAWGRRTVTITIYG
jgi:3D (Asp-Asp-Asp) domain-containing protein